MRSPLPKVLHEVAGQPLLFHILDQVVKAAPLAEIGVVVGHARETVESAVRANERYRGAKITFLHQAEQLGTGHAARSAMETPWGDLLVKRKATVLVLPGDLPLIPERLVTEMIEPLGASTAMRLLTCELADPSGYGRVVRRGKQGGVLRIVEEKDANQREKAIDEVAASIYSFQGVFLRSSLQKLRNRNAQGEYYLTDLVAMASGAKKKIDVLAWSTCDDLRGINDPWELALANRIYQERLGRHWAREAGVQFRDPWTTQIDAHASIGEGAVVGPGACIFGTTEIGAGARIDAHVVLRDSKIGARAHIKAGTVIESSTVSIEASVGPYAHLRPDSHVGAKAKIGNFVELKKARVGAGTSVAHLSYLGDATVGERVNIGCGFVTCNFDGRVIDGKRKHETIIEDEAFIGSDCQTIAPVRVGKGAYVASGSTITHDVESGALAIARARQVNKPGYAEKLKNFSVQKSGKGEA